MTTSLVPYALRDTSLRRIAHLLDARTPGRLGYALRITAACTLVALIGEIWQVPDQAVLAVVTLAVWQKDRVTNVAAGVALSLLIGVLVALLFALVYLTLDNPPLLAASVAVLSFGFFFLGSASKLKPLAYLLGLVVVYGLIAIDDVPSGEIITRALLYVTLFLLIPGAVLIGLGLLICPSPRTLLCHDIAARLRISARLLRDAPGSDREQAAALAGDGDAAMLKYAALAAKEKLWQPEDLARLAQAARSSVAILVVAMDDCNERQAADPISVELARLLDEAADIFDAGDCPQPIAPPSVADEGKLSVISDLMRHLTEPLPDTPAKDPGEKPSGFFAPDAFSNPVHVRYAVKGTASVMLAYFCFKITDWSGIHTIIITCFIVAQATMGEMIAKLSLRIAGAVTGGLIAIVSIVFIVPHLHDVTGFLGLVAATTLLAAWVKAGDARISYAGLQIGLAFFLTMLKDYGPVTDMETARDRMVGIIAGNLITYAMFTSFWPVSAYGDIPGRLRQVRAALRALTDAVGLRQRTCRVGAALHAVDDAERSIGFAQMEPHHLRAEMTDLGIYASLVKQASADIGTLMSEPGRHRAVALEALEALPR
ncbi:FUSC family protein [Brytella acorum]|uniref:FUSC family protein n=1 Tax=Brytella acorum TaxID=2959299 RepID=A0AA35UHW0_9PROT|nr:FUSC family protein [Brytella acorum]MDF3623377.1 FUSC family protein [Brytella acorum]CAI9120483.1 FUSC family protein [Brytella acorum]